MNTLSLDQILDEPKVFRVQRKILASRNVFHVFESEADRPRIPGSAPGSSSLNILILLEGHHSDVSLLQSGRHVEGELLEMLTWGSAARKPVPARRTLNFNGNSMETSAIALSIKVIHIF